MPDRLGLAKTIGAALRPGDRRLFMGFDIAVGDVTVRDGDYVIADASGVVFVAAAHIDAVLDAAEPIAAREASMAKALLGGQAIGEVMGAAYEHMLQRRPA